jgi:tRNA(fMet)-specific endonuclease VapC
VIGYSLDTNACIGLINGAPAPLRARFEKVVRHDSVVCVSTVVLHELWFGVDNSSRPAHDTERLRTFLAGVVEVVPFDDADAQAAGLVRAELARAGTRIGAYDVLIAGQAIRRGLTLVTANLREFERIDGLMWEDWA